jgi:putative DNA primase/helicase
VLPTPALRTFVQRVAGYCLTGDTSDEKFFFAHGPTGGGKSTLLGALRRTWGNYATTADFSTFTVHRHQDRPREDIARLHGSRLVVSVEVTDGTRLAEGLVKTLTGGDHVAARFLYERTFEFLPQFKLCIAANNRPTVRDDDDAMWRRLVEIPFPQSLPREERDPSVKATLMDPSIAGPAILAWAVEGAASWFVDGLGRAGRWTRPPRTTVPRWIPSVSSGASAVCSILLPSSPAGHSMRPMTPGSRRRGSASR